MAAKKQISASSDDDDSSFERFMEQRAPSLKRKQRDNEEEEEEEEEESESEDSSSDEDENEQRAPSLKRKQCDNEKEEEESESEDSSDEDENEQRAPSLKRKQCDNEKEEEESESEDSSSDEDENEQEDEEEAKSPATRSISHPSQAQQCTKEEKEVVVAYSPTKVSVPHPSDSEQSSEEEEEKEKEEEEEDHKEEENTKSPVQKSESLQPEKKTSKSNLVPGLSSSTTTNAVQRKWSLEDELVLLRALSHYHNTFNHVPSPKEYESFLSNIIGSLSFPATENQLHNKIRTWKTNYGQRKKMSSKAKSLNSHEKIVFKTCAKLFEDAGKTKFVGRVANSTSGDEAMVRCSIYLRELISRQKLPTFLSTIEDVVQKLGESRARDLEAKAKQLSIDAMKLQAREEKLMADLFDVVADEMAGDG